MWLSIAGQRKPQKNHGQTNFSRVHLVYLLKHLFAMCFRVGNWDGELSNMNSLFGRLNRAFQSRASRRCSGNVMASDSHSFIRTTQRHSERLTMLCAVNPVLKCSDYQRLEN